MHDPSDSKFFDPLIPHLQETLPEARMAGDRVAVLPVHRGAVE
jgi:hypothetical protein